MKKQQIREIAKVKGVVAGSLSKTGLIRAIQKAEGNKACFATTYRDECNQVNCLWREDCIKAEVECATDTAPALLPDEHMMLREEVKRASIYDSLTGLPNQVLFLDRLNLSIAQACDRDDYMFAALFLELDHYGTIKESLGYAAADQLLIEVGKRLQRSIRALDTAARIEEARFAIHLSNIKDIGDAIQATERLHSELKLPMTISGQVVFTTASIGIIVSKRDYERPEDILRDGCAAVNKAKTDGGACYVIFDETMQTGAGTSLYPESGLQNAFDKHEFYLNYSPVVLSDSNEITGFEALLRWRHPEKGQVLAAEFISVAEESGLIIPIGRWVLHEACRQMYLWHQLFPEKRHLTISVNISSRELTLDFAETVKQSLNETGLNPCSLQLEITERVITNHPEVTARVLGELKALGIKVLMDDFGTGCSSLGYLYVFPLDALKIDRSFVQAMCSKPWAMDIVKTIISMAHNMKMEVIAEGVEAPEQLEELRKLKCDYYQGYWFSKPLDRKEVETLLDSIQ